MTSSSHDDVIEVISSSGADYVTTFASAGSGSDSDRRMLTPRKPSSLAAVRTREEKQVGRAVMVVAGVLIVMSLLLVGATLNMSSHIDEMVRQAHARSTTPPSVTANAIGVHSTNVTVSGG